MNEPERTQWEIRCAFHCFCKKAIKYEASNARRDQHRRRTWEVSFSDLTPREESQLYTVDTYFADEDKEDGSFHVAGRRITPELLSEALRALPEEKRDTILLYYFGGLTDAEIARLQNITRSTAQYRRTSTLDRLRKFLEERAYAYE